MFKYYQNPAGRQFIGSNRIENWNRVPNQIINLIGAGTIAVPFTATAVNKMLIPEGKKGG